MPDLTTRFLFDPTGLNPNNFIPNEYHLLNNNVVRILVPDHGAFFSKNFKLFDASGNQLTNGSDFAFAELEQDATLKTGEEIYTLVLILNQSISSTVTCDIHYVGGDYQTNNKNIANLFEAFKNDNRPIDFSKIKNRPEKYPPQEHWHMLSDVFGWEGIVYALERLSTAITVGHTPAFEAIVDYINSRQIKLDLATFLDIDDKNKSKKLITTETLFYFFDKFLSKTIEPTFTTIGYEREKGYDINVNISTENVTANTKFYYRLTIKNNGKELYKEENELMITTPDLIIPFIANIEYQESVTCYFELFQTETRKIPINKIEKTFYQEDLIQRIDSDIDLLYKPCIYSMFTIDPITLFHVKE